MLGIKPRRANVPSLEHETRSKKNAAPRSRDHLELIARAKRIALDRMNEARAKYEETMDQAARNQSRLTKSFQPGEVVRYAIHYRDRMDNKQHPSYSERMVVVDDLGFHKYIVQPFGDLGADVIECHADDMHPEKLFSKIVAETAQRQATDALHQITEHEIEEITEERGVISQGTKEYLVKWVGYPVSTWESASNFDADCQPLRDFKANKRQSTSTRSTALIATNNYFDPLATECDHMPYPTLDIDILDDKFMNDIVQEVTKQAGCCPESILVVHESVPCQTFSIASHSNAGRTAKDNILGHGFNYRKVDEERSPCCPLESKCKYAALAWKHDKFAPALFKSVSQDRQRGLDYFVGIECVDGDLKHRPYMKRQNIPQEISLSYRPFHGLAFHHPSRAKKPYSF